MNCTVARMYLLRGSPYNDSRIDSQEKTFDYKKEHSIQAVPQRPDDYNQKDSVEAIPQRPEDVIPRSLLSIGGVIVGEGQWPAHVVYEVNVPGHAVCRVDVPGAEPVDICHDTMFVSRRYAT